MSKTKIIWVTPECEKVIGYCARVSNPANQDNPNVSKLLKYCMTKGHWSVFEMGSMCVEITTSRAISAQILRHRSFSFQEFSQRYAEATSFETQEARSQDLNNRQMSNDDLTEDKKSWFKCVLKHHQEKSLKLYNTAIEHGVAKECARSLLPLSTQTTLYMSGTIRSWIHYLKLRTGNGTQKEHMDIALDIKETLIKEIPTLKGLI